MALLKRRSSLDSNVFAEYNKIHTYCKNIVIAELFFLLIEWNLACILRELMKIERPSITTFLGYYAVLQGH